MALADNIATLPVSPTEGATGHLHSHATIHAALKDHHGRILAVEGESGTTAHPYEIIVDGDYTGSTDMQPTIQAAIDQGHAEGRPVRMKPGTLRLHAALTPRDGTILRGAGMGKTVLRPQGTANGIEYKAGQSGTPISDVIFSDFDIDGADQVAADYGYTPILTKGAFIEKMRRIEMRNLHIRNTGATGLGIDHVTGVIENVWAVNCGRFNSGDQPGGSGIGIGIGWLDPAFEPLTIANCHTENNKRYGIFIESQSSANASPSGITITGCTARGNKDGIGDAGGSGAIIIGCHVLENIRSGVDISNGTLAQGAPGFQSKIIGNDIRGNATGITFWVKYDRGIDGVQILQNTITGNTGEGIDYVFATSDTSATPNTNLRVEGNEIRGNGSHGMSFEGTGGGASSTLTNFWITGNRVWDNTGYGIRVNANTDRWVIDRNHAWDDQGTPTQTDAILMAKDHTNLIVEDNRWFTGDVTVPAA